MTIMQVGILQSNNQAKRDVLQQQQAIKQKTPYINDTSCMQFAAQLTMDMNHGSSVAAPQTGALEVEVASVEGIVTQRHVLLNERCT